MQMSESEKSPELSSKTPKPPKKCSNGAYAHVLHKIYRLTAIRKALPYRLQRIFLCFARFVPQNPTPMNKPKHHVLFIETPRLSKVFHSKKDLDRLENFEILNMINRLT